jgi:hypothetical protein
MQVQAPVGTYQTASLYVGDLHVDVTEVKFRTFEFSIIDGFF